MLPQFFFRRRNYPSWQLSFSGGYRGFFLNSNLKIFNSNLKIQKIQPTLFKCYFYMSFNEGRKTQDSAVFMYNRHEEIALN